MARQGLLAVFAEHTRVFQPRKRKSSLVEEGTVVQLRKIEADGKGNLKIWGTENKDSDWRRVKSTDVKIYTGQLPDWRLEVYLVEYGFQADTFAGLQPLTVQCRDYGGKHKIAAQVERLQEMHEAWLRMFKHTL